MNSFIACLLFSYLWSDFFLSLTTHWSKFAPLELIHLQYWLYHPSLLGKLESTAFPEMVGEARNYGM